MEKVKSEVPSPVLKEKDYEVLLEKVIKAAGDAR